MNVSNAIESVSASTGIEYVGSHGGISQARRQLMVAKLEVSITATAFSRALVVNAPVMVLVARISTTQERLPKISGRKIAFVH
jgi:hypothetical protein